MMKMVIDFSCKTTIILKFISIESCYWYTLALFVCLLIGILFEYLISLKDTLIESRHGYANISPKNNYKSFGDRIKLTLYYTLIVFMSHLIMFILMTYNFGIIVSILAGNAVGFFIFGFGVKGDRMSANSL